MTEPTDDTTKAPSTPAVPAAPHVDTHHTDEHDGAAGHDAAGHHDEPLGPIDWPAWGAGVLGVVLGLAVAVVFAYTTGLIAA